MDSREAAEYLGIKIVKKTRDWHIGHCPFTGFHKRGDKKPSFGVTITEDATESGFNCFACGERGTMRQLVYRLEGGGDRYQNICKILGYQDTLFKKSKLKEPTIVTDEQIRRVDYEKASSKFIDLPQEALSYLESRGINQVAIDMLLLQYDPKQKRIIFPIIDRFGDCYGFSGRSISSRDKEPIYVRDYDGLDKKFIVAGGHLHNPDLPILLCEGLTGLACLISNFVFEKYNVVANLGMAFTEAKAQLLLKYNTNIFILFDNDDGGYQGSRAYKEFLKPYAPVYTYNWNSTDKNDVDDLTIQDITFKNFN